MIKILNKASEEEISIITAVINNLESKKNIKPEKKLDKWKISGLENNFLPQSWKNNSSNWITQSKKYE